MIGGIILAAGRSERMGVPKLVLPFARSTVIARVADALLQGGVESLVVVVRHGDREIRTALGSRRVLLTENPATAGDMLSSVRCGLSVLPPQTSAILVTPGDMPALRGELIADMLKVFQNQPERIVVPVCAGRRGHPLVLGAGYRAELMGSHDGVGLRGLLQAHAGQVLEWPTEDRAVLEDLDTPEDYARLNSRFRVSY